MTPKELLSLPVMRDGKQLTVKQYLYDLLSLLWIEGKNFNSKRPFGSSGWEHDIYTALIKHKLIVGKLDKDDYVQEVDVHEANQYVLTHIIQPFFGIKCLPTKL